MRYWCPTTEVILLLFLKTIKHRDHKEIAKSKILTKKREKRIYADSDIQSLKHRLLPNISYLITTSLGSDYYCVSQKEQISQSALKQGL